MQSIRWVRKLKTNLLSLQEKLTLYKRKLLSNNRYRLKEKDLIITIQKNSNLSQTGAVTLT